MDAIPAALSVPAASRYLGISRASLYRLIKTGALVPAKVGGRTLIRRVDADAFLEGAVSDPRKSHSASEGAEVAGIFG
ncbi:helix-turn-helix domain-containing protein [Xaviernesmea oryzae]|uniref:helix-turn-helix domain-containing protein n=1 Tax=Xaviernesmea oryzae TaxID=464029 RepID=UPI0008B4BE02|nr:helix-turn-helix domain-containing protein [Xaviernesmea oryzae]SEK22426.1 DNA binding domain-containing protein, excisionase family [Xaviernesmea oryzae]